MHDYLSVQRNCLRDKVEWLSPASVDALRSLISPPRLQLSEWIESNIRLPEGVSALPGAIQLYPYQRDIADAISDPGVKPRPRSSSYKEKRGPPRACAS